MNRKYEFYQILKPKMALENDEIHVGKDYTVVIDNDQVYKIAIEYDEDEITNEINTMNKAREAGIPIPKVITKTDKGMIMAKAKGSLAFRIWSQFDINKKKTFIMSLVENIKKLPRKDNLILYHTDLDLQNIFVYENGVISDIIDWKDAQYLPYIYTIQTPKFLCEGNYYNTEEETNILTNIFHREMGELSDLENLIIELNNVNDEYVKNIVKRINLTISENATLRIKPSLSIMS